ncbi:hypothetical protein K9N08_00730 [Candidatus Gracilibacteria bacterium]|nr:hypothetical protein [Candidatus Gracilibacteria bacterium]MCF7856068.1 hypothetical protein [Candidatus Gracilibacteria bacterium]MCF7896377.1 hypothetical protein [Candidatus Gracilibacteria bacterium]
MPSKEKNPEVLPQLGKSKREMIVNVLKTAGVSLAASILPNEAAFASPQASECDTETLAEIAAWKKMQKDRKRLIYTEAGEIAKTIFNLNVGILVRHANETDINLKDYPSGLLWQNRTTFTINHPDLGKVLVTAAHGFEKLKEAGVKFLKWLPPEIDGEGLCEFDLRPDEVAMINLDDVVIDHEKDLAYIKYASIEGRDQALRNRENTLQKKIQALEAKIISFLKNRPQDVSDEKFRADLKYLKEYKQALEKVQYKKEYQGGLTLATKPVTPGETIYFFASNLSLDGKHSLRIDGMNSVEKIDNDKELTDGVIRAGESGGPVVVFRFDAQGNLSVEAVAAIKERLPGDRVGGTVVDLNSIHESLKKHADKIKKGPWRDPDKTVEMHYKQAP